VGLEAEGVLTAVEVQSLEAVELQIVPTHLLSNTLILRIHDPMYIVCQYIS